MYGKHTSGKNESNKYKFSRILKYFEAKNMEFGKGMYFVKGNMS